MGLSLLFDECMAPKWSRLLGELLGHLEEPIICTHLKDVGLLGAKDDEVVGHVSGMDPVPLIISADSGRQTKREEPILAELLMEHGITGVFLNKKLCNCSAFEKTRAVLTFLPRIQSAYAAASGSRYIIRSCQSSAGLRFEPWPYREAVGKVTS